MTLPPTDDWVEIHGVEGPTYKVATKCAVPDCERDTQDAHHMWRRSRLGGDYRWVTLHGKLHANLIGLCATHHRDVTGRPGGHRAAIRFRDGVFVWCLVVTSIANDIEYHEVGPLDPQPLDPDTLAARASGTDHDHAACPFCGQTRRRSPATPHTRTGGRRRKTWPVRVPADEQEQGAEVLDALVEDLAPLLGLSPGASARYYVLVPALYYAQQQRRDFIDSVAGVGA